MGKKNKNEYKAEGNYLTDLYKEKERIEKEIRRAAIKCSHTNSEGKLKVTFPNGDSIAVCKKCKTRFDFGKVRREQLDTAIKIMHNVINQCKALTNDPNENRDVIKSLGEFDYNLDGIKELYLRAINDEGGKKKKKNKNKNHDSFGSFGGREIDFLGSRKRR